MAEKAPQGAGFLTLLRKRNFLLLWLAQLISMTVLSAANFVTLALIHASHDNLTLDALVMIVFSLPAIFFAGPAGALVDRLNKKKVLFYSNCLRAIVTLIYIISLMYDYTLVLPAYLMVFLVSGIAQFFTPAEGASLAMMVDEDELMHALSLFQVTFMVSNALGLLILGPILSTIFPPFSLGSLHINSYTSFFLLMAVLYAICALLIHLIPQSTFQEPRRQKHHTGDLAAESLSVWRMLWHEMVQAWTFIRRRPSLFEAVIQLSFAGALLQLIGLLAVALVTALFGPKNLNLMPVVFAPAGVGLVLSSLFMPNIIKKLGKERTIFLGCVGLALMVMLIPMTTLLPANLKKEAFGVFSIQLLLLDLIMFVAGVVLNMVNIPSSTSMQEQAPEWIKGRILGLQLVLYNICSIPVLLISAVVIQVFSLSIMLIILSVVIALFGLWGLYYERKPHPKALVLIQLPPQDEADKKPETVG